jgi:alkanesulfonate monooxygenase SsuD/methylene tetrahydromethanopterin reductase-like flavin-dependent oxidoreductase (luciferase family)
MKVEQDMKIDAGLGAVYGNVKSDAKTLEDLGYDGIMSIEMAHDPFLPLMLAAEHTERVELKTSIAVAFARNPMILANLAHDLNAFSKGRFTLGLGSQIRPHITNRFSMPWSSPAARMKEMLEAIRAIWANWYDGEPLHYKGEFYNHTLMTPMFTPVDTQYGKPKIILAAVGPKMTEAAAQVADGMIIHSFSTEKYLREVCRTSKKVLPIAVVPGMTSNSASQCSQFPVPRKKNSKKPNAPPANKLPFMARRQLIKACWMSTAGGICSRS